MNISFDGDCDAPEVQLSAHAHELKMLGTKLLAMNKVMEIVNYGSPDPAYSLNLDRLVCKQVDPCDSHGLVRMSVEGQTLFFHGDLEALRKLGQSLINYFSDPVEVGTHMHLEYFKGNELIAPSDCAVIFMCTD